MGHSRRAPQKGSDAATHVPAADRVDHGPNDDSRCRSLLRRHLASLQSDYRSMVRQLDNEIHDGSGTCGDIADRGAKTFANENSAQLIEICRSSIMQHEHALDRLDQHSYGTCESCSRRISPERLDAFPSATLCVTCKASRERR